MLNLFWKREKLLRAYTHNVSRMHFKNVSDQTEEIENATSNQIHYGITDPHQTSSELHTAIDFQSCVIAIGFIQGPESEQYTHVQSTVLGFVLLPVSHTHLHLEAGRCQVTRTFEHGVVFLDREWEPSVDLHQQFHREPGVHRPGKVRQDCSFHMT